MEDQPKYKTKIKKGGKKTPSGGRPEDPEKTTVKSVRIKKHLVKRIIETAKAKGQTFNDFMVLAAIERLNKHESATQKTPRSNPPQT